MQFEDVSFSTTQIKKKSKLKFKKSKKTLIPLSFFTDSLTAIPPTVSIITYIIG